jgi:hypothetical protein
MSVETDTGAKRNAMAALRALATAFSVTALYPDPAGQPGFVMALGALSEETEPVILVVGPGSILFDGEELDPENETAHRLARELFIRDIEVVRLLPPVIEADLLAFFRALGVDEEELRDTGGLRPRLHEAGARTIEVYERGMLAPSDAEHVEYAHDNIDLDDLSDLAAAAHRGVPPSVLASMLEDGGATDEAVGGFLKALSELYDHAAPSAAIHVESMNPLDSSVGDAWRGFRGFMESFFFLDRPAQLQILETVLDADGIWGTLLVDQLSGAELADFYKDLSERGRGALAAWAAVVTSEQGRPVDEVISTMPSQAQVSDAKRVVATRISEVLAHAEERSLVEELAESVRAQIERASNEVLELEVVRALMECEDRTDRFKRIVRVWSGRVARYFRNGDIANGTALFRGVVDLPPYDKTRHDLIADGISRIADRNTIRLALERESGSEPSSEMLMMIDALGTPTVVPLVAALSQEEDGQRRRLLTELLSAAARHDPAALDPFLTNQPWFVLRNLATVLGKTGRSAAVPGVRRLLVHEDHRVRVEATRALARLEGDAAAPTLVRLLGDDHERVRQTAVSLARSIGGSELDQLLVAELEGGRLGPDEAQVVIRILGGRKTPAALPVIEKLASRRFVWGARRQVRVAAREALGRMR